MKLNRDFITHDTEDESLLVPVGGAAFNGLVKGNHTLGAILDLLKSETTEAEIVAAMRERFSGPEEIIARDVRRALTELRRIGALDE
ncbi:MAG: PqqD family protein [Clostridia bacterium]|nr:PqqD family protein [Clostridia bacterium]